MVAIAIFEHSRARPMPAYTKLFVFCFVLIFFISVVRSLDNIDIINSTRHEVLAPSGFLLSYFIKPLYYLTPFFITIMYCMSEKDIEYIVGTLTLSLALITVYLLYLYIFEVPDKSNADVISDYYALDLNMHRNDLANFYIVGFPIVLGRFFLKRNAFSVICLVLTVIGIGFLFSRTAYVTMILSPIIYLLISKRRNLLPLFFALVLGLTLIASPVIIDRALHGIQTEDVDEISAGRTDEIWLPLVIEYLRSPVKLMIGNGRYSVITSDSFRKGAILDTIEHPHNMYFEQILDVGILGFAVIMYLFRHIFLQVRRGLRACQDPSGKELQYMFIVSIMAYFIAGFSGRSLFPTLANSYFWLDMGVIVSLSLIKLETANTVYSQTYGRDTIFYGSATHHNSTEYVPGEKGIS
jgi:hypothetical protein